MKAEVKKRRVERYGEGGEDVVIGTAWFPPREIVFACISFIIRRNDQWSEPVGI